MESFFNSVLELLGKAEGQTVIVAMVLEFCFRMIKTEKPLSIAYMVAGAFKSVGEILSKVGALMDKVLPQKLK